MATLRIPETYRPSVAALLEFDSGIRRALVAALQDAPPFYSASQLSLWLGNRVPKISETTLTKVVDFLLSLYSVRTHLNFTTPELVDDFIAAMQESGDARLALSGEAVPSFRDDLLALVNIEAMTINEKAANVQNEGERLFHSARILTDIRPVFSENPAERPRAAVIMHTLRLQYLDEGGSKEIFFSLDGTDLAVLGSLVDRAIIKEETLVSLLDAAGLAHPGVESEP